MTYDASNRKDIRRAEKAARVQDSDRRGFVRASMSSTSGRSWFYQLLASCHLFHVLPPTNPLNREFEQGERNIGIQIYNDVLAFCPDLYLLMLHEAHTRDLSNARSDPDQYPDSANDSSGEQPRRSPSNGGDPGSTVYEPFDDGWDSNLIGLGDE